METHTPSPIESVQVYFTGPRHGDAFALRQPGDEGVQDKRTFDATLQGLIRVGHFNAGSPYTRVSRKHGGGGGEKVPIRTLYRKLCHISSSQNLGRRAKDVISGKGTKIPKIDILPLCFVFVRSL